MTVSIVAAVRNALQSMMQKQPQHRPQRLQVALCLGRTEAGGLLLMAFRDGLLCEPTCAFKHATGSAGQVLQALYQAHKAHQTSVLCWSKAI